MELLEEITKYNKKQLDFMVAFLENGNISKSCKIVNITEKTAQKYLKNGLAEEINKVRKKQIENCFKKLEYASLKATDTIIDILEDEKCPKSIKLKASKTILDYSMKIREQTDIIERLQNIEEGINQRNVK